MTARENITLQQVYEIVNRLEDKFDTSTERIDKRLARVEEQQAQSKGFAAAIGAVTGAGIALLGAFIQTGMHK